MLAKPNHLAIRTVVEQVTQGLSKLIASKKPGQAVTFEDVMVTTGPFAFTKVIMDYFKKMTGVEHTLAMGWRSLRSLI